MERVNFIWQPADFRAGYHNISLVGRDDLPMSTYLVTDWKTLCLPEQTEPLVTVGEASEIVALNVLEYLSFDQVDPVLDHWCELVAAGGTIAVGSVDLCEVTSALAAGGVDHSEANLLLHGREQDKWGVKRANYSMRQLSDALTGRGLVIERKALLRLYAVVVARRK